MRAKRKRDSSVKVTFCCWFASVEFRGEVCENVLSVFVFVFVCVVEYMAGCMCV